jgi:hypothetical protein
MAITTLAQVTSGALPTIQTTKDISSGAINFVVLSGWYSPGYPSAATGNTSGVAGQALTSSPNALPFNNPSSGSSYFTGVNSNPADQNSPSNLLLIDRLWENSGLSPTVITAQTVNSVPWPARDLDDSTNGRGVYIAFEVSATMGAGAPSMSMSYTNSAGVAGRTAVNIVAVTASATPGRLFIMGLQAGDVGVRSVQSFTLSSTMTSGTFHLIAYRPIFLSSFAGKNNLVFSEDAISLAMPQLQNNSVLQMANITSGNGIYRQASNLRISQG